MKLLKYIGKVPVKNFEGETELIPIGDMHIGHKATDYELLKKYINHIDKKPNAYTCLMGDELEAEIPSRSAGFGYEQVINVDEQLEIFYKMFKPLADKKKILTKCNSTHTGWTKKLVGHDIDKEIAKEVGADYLGTGGYWKLGAGEKSYTIFQQHGASSSKYPQFEISKAIDGYPTADVYLMGHVHQMSAQPYTKRYVFGETEYEKTIWGIRTGAFVGDKDWAREILLPRPNLGAPILRFDDKKLDIKVEIDSI